MLLRLLGLLILVGSLLGTAFAVAGLKRSPERIRDLGWESLFTSAGMTCIGFGLAFTSGVSWAILVVGGVTVYLYGLWLGYLKRRRGSDAQP